MRDFDWAAWLGLAVVLGIVEVTSLDLVFAMLAGGARVVMVSSGMGVDSHDHADSAGRHIGPRHAGPTARNRRQRGIISAWRKIRLYLI